MEKVAKEVKEVKEAVIQKVAKAVRVAREVKARNNTQRILFIKQSNEYHFRPVL